MSVTGPALREKKLRIASSRRVQGEATVAARDGT